MAALIGMPRAAWRRQPSGPVAYPNAPLVFLPGVTPHTTSGTILYGANTLNSKIGSGKIVSTGTSVSYDYIYLGSNQYSPTKPTIYLVVVKRNGNASANYPRMFGIFDNTGTVSNLWGFICDPDSKLLFDYTVSGYSQEYYAITTSAVSTTEYEVFVAEVSNGIRLYRNGTLHATGSAALYCTGHSTKAVRVGHQTDLSGSAAGLPCSVALAAVVNYQPGYAQALSENPWQIFQPRPARFILIPSSGPVTFQPFWARSRSLIIGV